MNQIDLFSGIGGFHLAGEMVWGDKFNTIAHVEIDPFCQKVLKKHWPEVPIISDIREYKHDGTTIDLLTGGPPCQPASCAGKQRGTKDDRWLWNEVFRVIREVKPTWCILENVKGLLALEQGVVFESLLVELEAIGYETESFIIPACAVNAPHRRDRVWIVANSRREHGERAEIRKKSERQVFSQEDALVSKRSISNDGKRNDPNSNRLNGNNARHGSSEVPQLKEAEICGLQTTSDSCNKGLQGRKWSGTHEKRQTTLRPATECNNTWNEPWLEAATRLCRVDDGVPNRVDRLKSLGNAIVPQVVVPIMEAIKSLENDRRSQY